VQLCSIRPVAEVDPRLTADGVPSSVSEFYHVNNVFKFKLDRPYYSGDKNDNEVKVLYIYISALLFQCSFVLLEKSSTLLIGRLPMCGDAVVMCVRACVRACVLRACARSCVLLYQLFDIVAHNWYTDKAIGSLFIFVVTRLLFLPPVIAVDIKNLSQSIATQTISRPLCWRLVGLKSVECSGEPVTYSMANQIAWPPRLINVYVCVTFWLRDALVEQVVTQLSFLPRLKSLFLYF